MANTSYLGANVVTTDSFAQWITKTNQVRHDMGTIAVTVTTASGAEPNTTNGGITTGNAAIEGVFTANTIAVSQYLRGGTVTSNAALTITSNAVLEGALTNIKSTNTVIGDASTDVLNVVATISATANAEFSGDLVRITSTNTTIGDTGADVLNINSTVAAAANIALSGALVNITSTNTTIGDAGTDALNVNAVADFNANVNIDGVTTVTANVTLSGALVNITSTNTTIGDAGTDALNVNAVADFNANVNVDGVLTVTANATFSGANVNINGNTTIGDLATDRLVVNATLSSDLIPLDSTIDLGSAANTYGNLHVTTTYTKDVSVSNSATVANTLTVNTQANTASLMVRNLTATRIAYVGTAGQIVDSANLTFSGTNLAVTGTADVTSNANVGGNIGVVGTANVGGTLGVVGAITASNTLNVTGLTTLSTANVTSNANVGGTLRVGGAFTAASTLAATGVVTASANVVLSGTGARTLTTNSGANAQGSLNINVANSTVSNTVLVANTTGIHAGANVTFDLGSTATYWKTLYSQDVVVSNTVTFATANVTGNANVAGTLGVTGAASFANTLAVAGDTTLSSNLNMGDSKYIRLGSSQDLSIYHDGSHSYINDSGTGNLKILTSQLDIANAAANGTMATFVENGAVTLFHNNDKKFETVANGVYVTGDVTVSGVLNLTSNVNLTLNTATSNTSTVSSLLTVNGNTVIGDASTDVIQFNASANSSFVPAANVTYNIGNTTNYWSNVYSNNNVTNNTTYPYHIEQSLSTTLTTVTPTAIASFSAAAYGAAEVTVVAKRATSRQISKLLVVHDGTTAYATEYGSILTGASLATYDVDISGGNVRILATSSSTSSTTYNVVLTNINA